MKEISKRILFQTLPTGSCFNLINCIIGQYSLFELKAANDCLLLEISREDIYKLGNEDVELKDVLDNINLKYTPHGKKYDFEYFNLNARPEK